MGINITNIFTGKIKGEINMKNWRDNFQKITKHSQYVDYSKIEDFIDQLLTDFSKEMIGKEAKPDWFGDEIGWNLKRQELIKIVKKYGVKIDN